MEKMKPDYSLVWVACQLVALRRFGDWKPRTEAMAAVLGCAVNTAHRLPYSLASGRETMTPRRVAFIARRTGLSPEFLENPTLPNFSAQLKGIFRDD